MADGELVLREPAQFKALSHPLRHRLLMALRQRPATLAQLAEAVGSTKGTVGYHVRVLVDAGLVRPAHTGRVRGGTEQYYEPSGGALRFAADAPVGGEFLVRAALGEMLPGGPELTVLRHVRLTTAQAEALVADVERFAGSERFAGGEQFAGGEHGGASGEQYGLLVSLYRADIPQLPPDHVNS
ncbi:ArsR/SmtB family transcription factor [Cryptosporangium phraense]|uniref:Winged helix-turn-helix transcriptional regulator n=1 Tax=Cryptosporangium phraense TaxID=2593070 RepID=A0A545B019_9ACTN|nr:winged helix-turn-helix domain-containing protein [Cryptosporangium phraense]TQS46908.1 winged helix-turn-helix transcriptional regulator [Cryptosporangium phraense]